MVDKTLVNAVESFCRTLPRGFDLSLNDDIRERTLHLEFRYFEVDANDKSVERWDRAEIRREDVKDLGAERALAAILTSKGWNTIIANARSRQSMNDSGRYRYAPPKTPLPSYTLKVSKSLLKPASVAPSIGAIQDFNAPLMAENITATKIHVGSLNTGGIVANNSTHQSVLGHKPLEHTSTKFETVLETLFEMAQKMDNFAKRIDALESENAQLRKDMSSFFVSDTIQSVSDDELEKEMGSW